VCATGRDGRESKRKSKRRSKTENRTHVVLRNETRAKDRLAIGAVAGWSPSKRVKEIGGLGSRAVGPPGP